MKNYLPFLIVLLVFLTPGISKAQRLLNLNDFYQNIEGINIYLDRINLDKKNYVAGSPYEQKDFVEGKVVQNDNTTYNNIPLRYNIYEDRIEYKHNNEIILYIDSPEKFKETIIGKQKYIFGKYTYGEKTKTGYYELLLQGEVSLIKKKAMGIKAAESEKPYVKPKPATFIKKPDVFYYLKEDNSIYEIKSKKDAVALLKDHNDKLVSFIKKNKLRFKSKKEQNLIDLVSYYNSL